MPQIELIALTRFIGPHEPPGGWQSDTENDAELLSEFSGRQCYKSWQNPARRTNAEYIRNLLEHGHLSVLEHASVSFAIAGISRSCSHELVRHRHLSFSQESQRYVPATDINFVMPPAIQGNEPAERVFQLACEQALDDYRCLLGHLERQYEHLVDPTRRKKAVREAARSVLPNAAETRIVVTGNLRAWRWFIRLRGGEQADREIRRLALMILSHLQQIAPAVFADFRIVTLQDGSQAVNSVYPY